MRSIEVLTRLRERGTLRDGGGAGLELPREFVPLTVLERDLENHVAAVEVRLHPLEDVFLAVEHARPGGATHLVAGEREEVHVEGLHVDRSVRDRLGGVGEDERVVVVGDVGQFADGIDGPERVRGVDDAHHLGVVGDHLGGRLHVEVAPLGDGGELALGAGALAYLLPRHERSVVFHLRGDHLVAGAEFVQPPGVGDEVYRLGGVLREHDLLAAVGTDEVGDGVVGLLVGDGGLLAQLVDAAVDVRVVLVVVVADGLDDSFRGL
jgi:hypothetical protein